MLAPNQSKVFVNSQAVEGLVEKGEASSITFFNGDDAIGLFQNGVLVDRFGQIGVDPGREWNDGTVKTQNVTLRRKDNSAADNDNTLEFFLSIVESISTRLLDGLEVQESRL